MFDWKKIKKPIIALAPMADYTDSPFSLICKKFGADVIYREMVSAEALVRGNEKTLKMAEFDKKERPIILQIFGANPKTMARAARILEEKFHPDGIDINMGCPARKIVGNFNGACLMKDPSQAAKIVEAVKSAVSCQVSVKTRTGWSGSDEILKFAPILEKAGADAIAIHGRTKAMGYAGKADWEIVGRVKEKLSIPVLLNGDIVNFESFKKAIDISGADGVLIGRGALGFPWIFRNIKNKSSSRTFADSHLAPRFAGRAKVSLLDKKDVAPSLAEIKKVLLEHAKLHLAHYGEKGIILFRKHAVSYFKGAPDAKNIRIKLAKINNLEELSQAFQ